MKITQGHKILIDWKMLHFLEKIIKKLSVRQTESLVRILKRSSKSYNKGSKHYCYANELTNKIKCVLC